MNQSSAETADGSAIELTTTGTRSRRRKLRRFLIFALVTCLLLAIDYFAYPYGNFGSGTANRDENGLWLRYTWYFGLKPDQKNPLAETDLVSLANRLKRARVRYAYFHVRSITKQGMLKYRHLQQAKLLTSRMKALAPAVKLLAWIYAGNRRGEGEVDLAQPDVRKKMVEQAVWLVDECGFDGVQWDYEICAEEEPGFIELLIETRSVLPPNSLISVATPLNMPWPLGSFGWSERYYSRVARECDQMCVMSYDSGAWLPRSYAALVHRQAVTVSRAIAAGDPACRLLIGLPTYGPGFISHNPRAENIRIALKGLREGMADSAARRDVFAGAALFADYTTDEREWRSFDDLWIRGS